MKKHPSLFKNLFKKNDSGNVATMTAMLMPFLVGSVGLGVETAYWFHRDLQLQQAADKAAYAAAIEKREGTNSSGILSAVTTVATNNGYVPGTLVVNDPPTSGDFSGSATAIEVKLSRTIPRAFTALFISEPLVENARAVAIMQPANNACVLALSKNASPAVEVAGNASVTLTGCNVMANSVGTSAVSVTSGQPLTADCIVSVGGIAWNNSVSNPNVIKTCPKLITDAPPAADPYASLPTPTSSVVGSSTTTGNGNNARTNFQPGNYTNGMTITGTSTLAAGVYIISGGVFKINANSVVTGSGVTIYIANGASVSINGTATVQLTAPVSGTYAGVLFFGARNGTAAVTFNGTANSALTGALYFPNQDVSYLGNYSGTNGCTQVVANTIKWSGSVNINQNCSAFGLRSVPGVTVVKLVE
jgi:Flp pilus assembly protein TadG